VLGKTFGVWCLWLGIYILNQNAIQSKPFEQIEILPAGRQVLNL